MGGPLVMRTMAFVPDRVKAGGSFHGGGLATAQPTSPLLLVPQMKSKAVLIAVAQNDDKADTTVKDKVKAAFDAQNIPAKSRSIRRDHGWCPPDSQVFDQVQADRAWGGCLRLSRRVSSSLSLRLCFGLACSGWGPRVSPRPFSFWHGRR